MLLASSTNEQTKKTIVATSNLILRVEKRQRKNHGRKNCVNVLRLSSTTSVVVFKREPPTHTQWADLEMIQKGDLYSYYPASDQTGLCNIFKYRKNLKFERNPQLKFLRTFKSTCKNTYIGDRDDRCFNFRIRRNVSLMNASIFSVLYCLSLFTVVEKQFRLLE